MKLENIHIGMKVIPKTKSVGEIFKEVLNKTLYVRYIQRDHIFCSEKDNYLSFEFLASDLIPYENLVMTTPIVGKLYLVTDYIKNYYNEDGFIGECIQDGWFKVGNQKHRYNYWRPYMNCELEVGKMYYVSDRSIEEAQSFKETKNEYALQECISVTYKIFQYNEDVQTFKYWVKAEDEFACVIPGVTTDLIPGKKYWVSHFDNGDAIKAKKLRIYAATIGKKSYFVYDEDEIAYPNDEFKVTAWKYAVDPDRYKEPETELTVEQIADLLRRNNLLTGKLKIKE